jgi:hypothetical protein
LTGVLRQLTGADRQLGKRRYGSHVKVALPQNLMSLGTVGLQQVEEFLPGGNGSPAPALRQIYRCRCLDGSLYRNCIGLGLPLEAHAAIPALSFENFQHFFSGRNHDGKPASDPALWKRCRCFKLRLFR